MNKKGQFSQGFLLWLIIGIVAVAFVLYFFTDVFGSISDAWGFAPDDLSKAAIACAGYVSLESPLNYCNYRELTINSKKQWVNCNFIYDEAEKKASGSAGFTKLADGTCLEDYCVSVLQTKANYDGKSIVNGVLCPKV